MQFLQVSFVFHKNTYAKDLLSAALRVDKKGRNAEIVQLAVKYLQKNNLRRKA